jgi:hypothetical protein
LLSCGRISHPGAVDEKRITFPRLFGFLDFREGLIKGTAANEEAYLPGSAKRRAEFVRLTQQFESSFVISLEVVRDHDGARDNR